MKFQIHLFLIGILLFIQIDGQAQQKQLLRVFVQDQQQAEQLARMPLDFASRYIGAHTDIVATAAEEQSLRAMGFKIAVLESAATLAKKWAHLDENMGKYHTYAEVTDELQQIAAAFPQITSLQSLGKSWENRDIWAMLISDNPTIDEPQEPGVLYIGNIHAREIITPEIVLHFLNYLVYGYGVDAQATRLVQTRRIWLVPMMNPDGHVQVEQGNRWWRKNRRPSVDSNYGVDLNRNFGYRWGYDDLGSSPYTWSETYRGPEPFSEPEAEAIRNLVRRHPFAAAITYHSYGRLWLFPWCYAKLNTEHHPVFMEMAGAMVDANDYTIGNTAMGAIYLVNGCTDDYFYGEQNEKNTIFAFTAEVGTTFFPPEEDIPRFLAETLPANIYLAEVSELLMNDPWRMLRPEISPLYAALADDDGRVPFFWQPLTAPPNEPVTLQLQELCGYRIGIDHADQADSTWSLHGFSKIDQNGFDDPYCYYAGAGYRATMTLTAPIIPRSGQLLTFKISYRLYYGYDYLYVRISQDQGSSWRTISGNLTSFENPYGYNNLGNGITGNSPGWVTGQFDLTPFADKPMLMQFLLVSSGSKETGEVYIDDIEPAALVDHLHTNRFASWDSNIAVYKQLPGNYVFRLRGIDGDGQASRWSDPVTVTVDFGQLADVVKDGVIDQLDIDRCREIILRLGKKATSGELYRADIDASGKMTSERVNVVDLVRLIKKMY